MIQTRTVAGSTSGFLLSLVFALLLLGIQSVEFWLNTWLPPTGQSAPITLRLPAFSVFRLHLGQPAELVPRQVIIGRGEVIEPNEDARLAAAYEDIRRESQVGWSLGMFFVIFVASLLLLAEFRRAPGDGRLLRAQATVLALVLLLALGAKVFLLLTSLPAYYYPMPAVVLLVAFLMGRRSALAVNLFASTVFASMLGFDLSAFVVMFTTSYAGTLFLRQRKKRRAVVQAGSLAGWFGAAMLLVLMLLFSGTINVHRELLNPDYSAVLAAVVNGVLSGLIALLLIEPVGWLVGRVSPTKLIDLQNLDHPILKRIRDEAPGTWEHSRAVANMAEAAAAAIGADSLLVRVGAYVHDAGKALNPAYFIENQTALAITNPHEEIDPEVSADCIFDHVREGTDLLRKHRVPEALIEFAYTHHGTSLLEYFWFRNMQAGNPKGLKERSFQYPGTRPRTRETGILMIVDAVEAASRTIKEPIKHKFEALVQRIIFTKLAQGQLDKSGLTLADLKTINATLVELLVNMYHARIEYPWQRTTITQTGPQAVFQSGQHVAAQTGRLQAPAGPLASPAPEAPAQQPSAPASDAAVTQTGPQNGAGRETPEAVSSPRAEAPDSNAADEPAPAEPPQPTRRKVVTKTLTGVAPVADDAPSPGAGGPENGRGLDSPPSTSSGTAATSSDDGRGADGEGQAAETSSEPSDTASADSATFKHGSVPPEALASGDTKERL